MANDFPQGVAYFTNGEIRLVVHFPENKVMVSLLPVLSLRKRFRAILVPIDKQYDIQPERAVAAELKPSYFAQMAANCKEICDASHQLSLFEF